MQDRPLPSASRPAGHLLLGGCALALVAFASLRPMLHGSSARDVALTWAFHLGYVLLPGWLAWRTLRAGATIH
jgi:hypothetical protein